MTQFVGKGAKPRLNNWNQVIDCSATAFPRR